MDQLQHFSHDHPLMFKEEVQKNKDGAATVCRMCKDSVLGPSYSCGQCSEFFILHRSCAELPREMHHPIHRIHPLVLSYMRNCTCDICWKTYSDVFAYRCEPCRFKLHLQCASNLSNIKYLEHFSHEHALIIEESPRIMRPCQGCKEKVLGQCYRCSRILCEYYLHKSCAEMPVEFRHPMHPKHPLILNKDKAKEYICHVCNRNYSGKFTYSCLQCDFHLCQKCICNWNVSNQSSCLQCDIRLRPLRSLSQSSVCSACGDPMHGPSYYCIRCTHQRSNRYIIHKSCGDLPREMHHPIHNIHPLVLLPNRNYRCDICRKSHSGLFSYRCSPCDFNLDIQCASDLSNIEYIEHFSHEHALIFVEDPKRREEGLPVICQGCQEDVLGPGYCCSRFLCHYTLHKSCAELLREIHHPIHKKHPLVLLPNRNYRCDICRKSHSGVFSYRCSPCGFDLDIQCASDLSNIKYIEHFSHEHALIFVEDPKRREEGLPVVCQGCQEDVFGPGYCCSRFLCHYTLHKSCAELPHEIHDPIHNKHPLVLLPNRNYSCDICRKLHSGFFSYRCSPCDFDLDIQCASDLSNIKYIEHLSHEHALIFVEDPKRREEGLPVVCQGCQEDVLGPSYCCSRFLCHYTLHKSCAELPREIHHPIHKKHPLVLLPNRNYSCDICRKSHSGLFSYRCSPCDYNLDIQCASDLNNIKYIEHFSHEHALIFVEDPKRREEGLPVVCQGCQEDVLGQGYCCSRFLCHYTLHKSCAELSHEIHHPIHNKHPLVLFPNRIYSCDICRKSHSGFFSYRCSPCDFDLDIQCASDLSKIKYKEHFSHEHALIFVEDPKRREEGLPVVCQGCQEDVLGLGYCCSRFLCHYTLHKSCVELPREIHHPIHNQHPLVLLPNRNYSCDICRKSHAGLFSYRCSPCDYDLDIQCASDLDNIKYIEHFSHEHALIFVEDPKRREEGLPVVCQGCHEDVLGPGYCCSRFLCHYTLHKSCVELPREIHHPIHNKHPLVLVPNRNYSCDICRKSHSGLFSYRCSPCDYDLDIRCASDLNNIKYIEHFSHEHALIFVEDPKRREEGLPVVCQGCLEDVLGPGYCCSRFPCHYTLHKSCAELPSEFRHPMHTKKHSLVQNKDRGRGFLCDACDQDCSRKFTYSCFQCDFNLDSKCALNWTGFKHFSHEHPLSFVRESKKKFLGLLFCDACQEPILGPSYTCINTFRRSKCAFNLHKECAELPHEFKHPMHHQHLLFLQNILPVIKQVRRLCNVCNEPGRFLYCCSICDFNLHPMCSSNWKTILADDSHEHQFKVLRRKLSALHAGCDVCGEYWTATIYYMCSICELLVHKECASLPRSIKKPDHQHHLKLTWFVDSIYPNNLSCIVCSISMEKCRAAYCCSECSIYVTHVACTTAKYSRDEIFPDIASEDDESDDAPEITHFSHPHSLAVNDPCEQVNDEHRLITCEGCIRPITATKESFYSCTKQEEELCSFFLHKVCAQLPKEMLLPILHQHQFTLQSKAPFIGGVFRCYMCGAFNQGFTYTCEECASQRGETVFFLDLQCSAYWDNKALKHDSHIHRLLLNTEWENVQCSGCGCDIFFCFSCKRCEFHLCIPCARLPLTGRHRYDDHPLKLTYGSVYSRVGYYCQICEGTRDPKQWFYRCNECDFDCHAHCIVGRYPQVKLGSTCKHEAHAQHLVTLVDKARSPIRGDKRENILPCLKCGEPCVGLVFECRECSINIHREGFCQVTDLESSANQASIEEPSQ